MKMQVACIQLNTGVDIEASITAIRTQVEAAGNQGAQFIVLPENAFYMQPQGKSEVKPPRYTQSNHPGVIAAKAWAKQYGVWLLVGSVQVSEDGVELPFNRSLLIAPGGEIAAQYDKIHLFDVELPNGESYAESSKCAPGGKAVVSALENGFTLGMSVCYDVRFPHLYRTLANMGANILAVPAAFTRPTGEAHWHVLLRARAIENGCFVIAPAQCGIHPGGRGTYGHSLIIDPWGKILAEGSVDEPGIIMATLDLAQVEQIRQRIPSLQHDREFSASDIIT